MPLPLLLPLIASGTQALIGGIQAATSGAKKRERELEEYAKFSPVYEGSKIIDSHYKEALNRYQQSPYQTSKFIMGKNLADRAMASGLSALNQRGMALAGVQNLTAQKLDNINRLVVQGGQDRRQDFQTLGEATRMKAQDEMTQFDINQMTPYNRQLALKQMKAQAANERKNAGLQMLAGGLSNAAMAGIAGMGVPSTPKELPSIWSSLGSNNNVITLDQYNPRKIKNTSAPTTFTGNPLIIR